MRVTDKLIFQSSTRSVATGRERAEKAAREASSGVRVVHPGDDPGVAGLIVAARANEVRQEAIGRTVERANDELIQADGALGMLNNGLRRAQQLAIQLANANYSPGDLQGSVAEVEAIISTALAVLNTRVGDRYIFGGNKDSTPPFDENGNYQGDDGVRKVEVAPGVLQDVSVRPDIAIKGAGGGVDILATLHSLRDGMQAGDQEAVRGTLDDLNASVGQVASARAGAGAAMNVLETARDVARLSKDAATEEASRLADADLLEASSRMVLAQRALEAAMAVSVRSFDLSLLKLLR